MNMEDMCLCGSKECKYYNECYRGGYTEKHGIYTISFLSQICNEHTNYQYIITDNNSILKEIKDNEIHI